MAKAAAVVLHSWSPPAADGYTLHIIEMSSTAELLPFPYAWQKYGQSYIHSNMVLPLPHLLGNIRSGSLLMYMVNPAPYQKKIHRKPCSLNDTIMIKVCCVLWLLVTAVSLP